MKSNLSITSPTKRSATKTIYAALTILKENGLEMMRKDLLDKMNQEIEFEPWELQRYDSNGQLKWLTIFLFYTIDCIKAGWLVKNKGTWYLTPEGEKALSVGPEQLLENAGKAYREWKSNEVRDTIKDADEKEPDIRDEQVQTATLDEIEAQAKESIGSFLESIEEYRFQKLCSILLKAMGLYIEYIAPPGPDGGVDIIAFKDPLGYSKPRIKVQVKRYKSGNKIDIKPIRELRGLLNASEHIGIFMTSGYFTKDAEQFARQSDIHIKLIDRDDLIDLWRDNYDKLNEEEKSYLPLHPIYFLGNSDIT